MTTVLICDDEKDIVSAVKIYLTAEGYHTLEAYNGEEALSLIRHNEVHLVLLDIMMPHIDGITTLSRIREFSNLPVIFMTAKSEDNDIILGLNIGADDYITKPFNPVELIARVRSQIRRYTRLGGNTPKSNDITVIGNIEINDKAKTVTVDGDEVNLTPTEFDILKLLAQNPNVVFSATEIYKSVWHDEPFGCESTIAVHIRHLREKVEITPNNPRYIKVVWGKGYKIEN